MANKGRRTFDHLQLMVVSMDIAGSCKAAAREVVSNVEEEEEEVKRERQKVEMVVLAKLTTPCLAELEAALDGGRLIQYRGYCQRQYIAVVMHTLDMVLC